MSVRQTTLKYESYSTKPTDKVQKADGIGTGGR